MKVRLVPCHLRHPTRPQYAGVSPAQFIEITGLDPLSSTDRIIQDLERLLRRRARIDAGAVLFRIKLGPYAYEVPTSLLRAITGLILEIPGRPQYQVIAGQVVRCNERPKAFDILHRPDQSLFCWELAIPFSAFRRGKGHGTTGPKLALVSVPRMTNHAH